jgi:hypothetical protein
MLVIGSIGGAAGGVVVGMFNIMKPDWGLSIPSSIKDGPNIDVWGTSVVAFVYA